MKLVACFSTSDGCTWSADHTFPIEYESQEQLLVDYENEVHRAAEKHARLYADAGKRDHNTSWEEAQVRFFGEDWALEYMYDRDTKKVFEISIFTLEDWFKLHQVNRGK
jgi:hypothetical protein